MPRPSRFVLAAIALGGIGFCVYKFLKAMSESLMEDLVKVLRWLAERHPSLADYEPPGKILRAVAAGPRVDALVVHGCSMVAVPSGAADLFVDVLHPAGCRAVVLTGGVGRETLPLWAELAERNLTALFGVSWASNAPPSHVVLPAQGGATKPVLDGFNVNTPPEVLREYASEADVFLEIFLARCRERGLHVEYGGNPLAGDATTVPGTAIDSVARVYLETASTHTGTNVEFSRRTLEQLGMRAPTVAVVQQPALHRRTCATWQKQLGVAPIGWTLRPDEVSTGRTRSEMLLYALGELRRIPKYAKGEGYCVMPADFPHELVPRLEALESSIAMAVAMEKEAKAKASRPAPEDGLLV